MVNQKKRLASAWLIVVILGCVASISEIVIANPLSIEGVEQQREREIAVQREREAEALQRAREAAEAAMRRQLAGETETEATQAMFSVMRAVQSEWGKSKSKYQGQDLRATVQVDLSPLGELESVRVVDESGNHEFDYSALVAIQNAAPFSEIRDLPEKQRRDFTWFKVLFSSR